MVLTAEEPRRTCVMLTDLEEMFRSLKSEPGLRPIFRSTGPRAEGHLFITVLAYQLVQVIRKRLRAVGLRSSCATLKGILWRQVRTTSVFELRGGYTLHVRTPSHPDVDQREIFEALAINTVPLPMYKTVFSTAANLTLRPIVVTEGIASPCSAGLY